ncbi:phage integrase family protein [Rhodovulum marinum]|uniref:Phage integrase family protein n=1 Tax=Rhodovulum marinum TaxID=320662 RepID=A0A4R2PSE9_9RHOB|nr:phage integrase family protein [Rhodovulum marinum]
MGVDFDMVISFGCKVPNKCHERSRASSPKVGTAIPFLAAGALWELGWTHGSRLHERLHISTRQYARLAREWVRPIGLDPASYGTHSMRRTKVAQIYRKTGNLRAVQLLLGHTKMDSTIRYLGVELEDALAISESVEI